MAVINDFSTNYMKALGLNQAYILLKLRNNYYIVLICSFGSITGNIHITALDNNCIRFFFICITRMIFDDTENYMDTENAMSINKKLKTIWILRMQCQSIRKIILTLNVHY